MRDAVPLHRGRLGWALAYAMLTRPFSTISGFHLTEAVPGGGGRNAVNVILVDFRGFDTLGEIAVLAMSALGVRPCSRQVRILPYAVIASRADRHHPLMLEMLMRPLLPLALTVSLYLLLRSHNAPGGGFIAGLVTAIALVLQYLASGIADTERRLALDHPACSRPVSRWRSRPARRAGPSTIPFSRARSRTCVFRCSASSSWPRRWSSTSASTSSWWLRCC